MIRKLFMATLLAVSAFAAAAQDRVVYHINDTKAQALAGLRNARNQLDTDPTTQIVFVAHAEGVDFLMEGVNDRNGSPYRCHRLCAGRSWRQVRSLRNHAAQPQPEEGPVHPGSGVHAVGGGAHHAAAAPGLRVPEALRRHRPMRMHCARRAALALLAAWACVAARAADDPELAMASVQVAPHSYFVQGQSALGTPANRNFISNAGFVVTDTSVVVIDALGSPALARRLLQEIRRITPKPVSHVLVTHYHADHIYGLQAFKEAGATIVAHRLGRDYLQSDTAQLRLQASRQQLAPWVDGRTRLVAADRWLEGATDLTIGGIVFQIRPVGPSHSPEDLVFYLPSERVLFAGDLVFRGRIPYVGQADSKHWITALDELLKFDAQVIVPGHGPQSNSAAQDLTLTRDYLIYLRQAMGEAARNLEPFDEAYRKADWSRFEKLPLFHAANRMNAYNTYLLMEQER